MGKNEYVIRNKHSGQYFRYKKNSTENWEWVTGLNRAMDYGQKTVAEHVANRLGESAEVVATESEFDMHKGKYQKVRKICAGSSERKNKLKKVKSH